MFTKSINKAILVGRLGADPEVRYTASGAALANFNLATNRSWKGKDGNRQEETTWHRVIAWRGLAELVKEYLKKGNQVYVEGYIQNRSWEDQSGQKRYTTEVVAQEIQLLESGSQRMESDLPEMSSSADIKPPEDTDTPPDDVPF